MAMMDYGSIVKKNGKIIQKEMFMDMKEAVGFTIDKIPYTYEYNEYDEDLKRFKMKTNNSELKINHNQFSYIGDKNFLVCIYKGSLKIISNNRLLKIIHDLYDANDRILYAKHITINGVTLHIKRLFNQNRYKLHFVYKNNVYDVVYGYGVDVNKDVWYNVSPKEKIFIDKWFNEN